MSLGLTVRGTIYDVNALGMDGPTGLASTGCVVDGVALGGGVRWRFRARGWKGARCSWIYSTDGRVGQASVADGLDDARRMGNVAKFLGSVPYIMRTKRAKIRADGKRRKGLKFMILDWTCYRICMGPATFFWICPLVAISA